MHAALLGLVNGEPERMPIETDLRGFPAIQVESTAYLDGKEIYHGTAANTVEQTVQNVYVDGDRITTTQEKTRSKVACEWYADLEAGFIGVDSSDGEWLFQHLALKHGVEVFEAVVDLDAFASKLAENVEARAWQVSRKETFDEDGDAERVEIKYHDSANLVEAGRGGNIQLGFEYYWDGMPVRGTVAASGYVAIYSSMTVDTFGRWMCDELVPHLEIPDSGSQAFLKDIREREGVDV